MLSSRTKRVITAKVKNIQSISNVFATMLPDGAWMFVTRQRLAKETVTAIHLVDNTVQPGYMALEVSSVIGKYPGTYNVSLMWDGARLLASTRGWKPNTTELNNGEIHSLGAAMLTWPDTWPLEIIAEQANTMVQPLVALTDLYLNTQELMRDETLKAIANAVGR